MRGYRGWRRNDSLIALGFLATILVACARQHPVSFESMYEQARLDLQRGNLREARLEFEQGAASLVVETPAIWQWKYRLLSSEILIAEGRVKEALQNLNFRLPTSADLTTLEPQHKYDQAWALIKFGQPQEAYPLLEDALKMASTMDQKTLAARIEVLVGQALTGLKRVDEAEAIFRTASQHAIEHGDVSSEAAALNNLGVIRLKASQWDAAIPWLERARAASEKAGQKLSTSAILGNLSECYYRLGDLDRSLEYRQRAMAIQEREHALGSLQFSLGQMGNIFFLKGDIKKAIEYYQRGVEMARELGVVGDAAKWAGNLANAFTEIGDWDRAERFNNEAHELKLKTGNLESLGYIHQNAAMIAAGRNQFDRAVQLFERAIENAHQNVGIIWGSHAGLAELYRRHGNRTLASQHFQQAVEIIEARKAELSKDDYKITYLTQLIRFYREYVDALMDEGSPERALEVADSSRARVLAERMGPGTASSAVASFERYKKSARDRNAVLLSYWLAPKRSFAWLITAKATKTVELPSADRITSLVDAYHSFIQNQRDPLESDSRLGAELFDVLVRPVQDLIPPGSQVVLVPDGALHNLNFDTLPADDDRKRYWIEDVTISIVPSLAIFSASQPAPSAPQSLLLIGAPQSADPEFAALPFGSDEMSHIQQRLESFKKTVYQGAQASPGVYKSAHPENFSMIHFTTHATANRQSPLDSAIILSAESDDYKLYARDILRQPLNASLVTISACRSAGARTYAGEGLVGFTWAFLNAGARNVIAGLWDVSDASTAALMDRLYAEISAGRSAIDALRLAKLQLIHSASNYRKPYYWGPFQIYTRGTRP